MRKTSEVIWCAMIGMAMLAGCGTNGGATTTASPDEPARPARMGLIPQSRPPIADLPVPIGFKLVESLSRDFKSADSRYVDHTYEGRDEKYDVERFYSEQMPLRNWVFRSRQMSGGQITMLYDKAGETATVRIEDARGLLGTRTAIKIKVNDPSKPDAGAARTNE